MKFSLFYSSKEKQTKFSNIIPFYDDPKYLNFALPLKSSINPLRNTKSKSFITISQFSDYKIQSPAPNTTTTMKQKQRKIKKIIFEKNELDHLNLLNTANNKVRIFHENMDNKLNLKNTNNLITSLHRRPARDVKSMTSKILFRSNLSKYFDGKFSDYKEFNRNFALNNSKKSMKHPELTFSQEKIQNYLSKFSTDFPHMIKSKTSHMDKFKTITKLNFKEKDEDRIAEIAQNQPTFARSHKRTYSHYSSKGTIVSPKERNKFSRIINYDALDSMKKRNLFENYDDFPGITDDNLNNNEAFEEFLEENQDKFEKYTINDEKIEVYDMILNKIEEGEKKREMSFLNNTYKKRFKKALLKERMLACLLKLSKMNLNIADLPKISYKPYQREGSFLFLEAVRLGDQMKIEEMLHKNQLFIYDFDQFQRTALHIACKKKNLQFVKILIENGAELNCIDIKMKTPLYFAVENNFLNGLRYLLYSGANPWSTKECNYEKATKSKLTKLYLKKAKEIYIILKFVKNEIEKKKMWAIQRNVFAKIIE